MRTMISLAFATSLGLFSSMAQAMPALPGDMGGDAVIIKVSQGCGPGFHRGPYGHCRPVFSCPRGWHSGPFGQRCFRNR
jgi:hypothetical protein